MTSLFIIFNITIIITLAIIVYVFNATEMSEQKTFNILVANKTIEIVSEERVWKNKIHSAYEKKHGKTLYSNHINMIIMDYAYLVHGHLPIESALNEFK